MILIMLYSVVALATSQRQEQPLCPTLRNLYDAHCPSDGSRSPVLLPSQPIPGKRGPVGAKGERGLNGLKGQKGSSGEVDYDRMDQMISQRTQGDPELSTSCFHLLHGGETTSGVYSIKPSRTSSTIEVFCDMESAGGGWTLVASVHENNIVGKCTIGDKWSSESGRTSRKFTGSTNWENLNTFGTADGATSSDYKSPAYFNVPASDVMIWHVPNNVRIAEASSRATLKYHTDSQFLTRYGGTLQSLFHQHYPMKSLEIQSFAGNDVRALSRRFSSAAPAIRSLVPNFHLYTYDYSDSPQNYIKDGGSDMYDAGNKVFYRVGDGSETQITYDLLYSNNDQGAGMKVLATTSHPFNVLMWIGNSGRAVSSFSLKVTDGTGADNEGSFSYYGGSMTDGALKLNYHSYSVHSASDPSITKVFYYITDEVNWGSVPPATFTKTPWTSGTDALQHGVKLTGNPQSILMGYMLLSKIGGVLVADREVQAVLFKMMKVLRGASADCSARNRVGSLVQPIQYLKGDNEKVLSGVPPKIRAQSTPGFIQFRAYTEFGIPHSICPGAKTDSCRPQSLCLGGMNSVWTDETTCGDFSGWDGLPEDSPTASQPDGYARSISDQQSSILIFTRQTNNTLP